MRSEKTDSQKASADKASEAASGKLAGTQTARPALKDRMLSSIFGTRNPRSEIVDDPFQTDFQQFAAESKPRSNQPSNFSKRTRAVAGSRRATLESRNRLDSSRSEMNPFAMLERQKERSNSAPLNPYSVTVGKHEPTPRHNPVVGQNENPFSPRFDAQLDRLRAAIKQDIASSPAATSKSPWHEQIETPVASNLSGDRSSGNTAATNDQPWHEQTEIPIIAESEEDRSQSFPTATSDRIADVESPGFAAVTNPASRNAYPEPIKNYAKELFGDATPDLDLNFSSANVSAFTASVSDFENEESRDSQFRAVSEPVERDIDSSDEWGRPAKLSEPIIAERQEFAWQAGTPQIVIEPSSNGTDYNDVENSENGYLDMIVESDRVPSRGSENRLTPYDTADTRRNEVSFDQSLTSEGSRNGETEPYRAASRSKVRTAIEWRPDEDLINAVVDRGASNRPVLVAAEAAKDAVEFLPPPPKFEELPVSIDETSARTIDVTDVSFAVQQDPFAVLEMPDPSSGESADRHGLDSVSTIEADEESLNGTPRRSVSIRTPATLGIAFGLALMIGFRIRRRRSVHI